MVRLVADKDITANNASHFSPVRANATGSFTVGQHAVLKDVATMKTFLNANGYPAATTAVMTKGDMTYALTTIAAFNAL